jgi:hypothetical protein
LAALPTDNELMTDELVVTLHPLANVPGPKLAGKAFRFHRQTAIMKCLYF